ncbi:MAG: hypothetical protein LBS17_00290 [Actinomycetes bacterium]|jgi:uncharacterized protein (DUF697 family)|nr:hypothetical protein [Actinomycetes bacterium]
MKLPYNPLDLFKSARSLIGSRSKTLKLGIFLDPRITDALVDRLTELFIPAAATARVYVHVLTGECELGDRVSYDAIIAVLAADDLAHDIVDAAARLQVPLLLIGQAGLRQDWARSYGMSILDVLSARHPETLPAHIAAWCADRLPAHRQALAADFAWMRDELARGTILSAAQQNAVIGLIGFIPGADLPVMTLTTARMTLQLSFIYGQSLSAGRAAEVAVVTCSAFASRAVARLLVSAVPQISWITRAAVGFTSTWALGRGLLAYYERGNDTDRLLAGLYGKVKDGGTRLFKGRSVTYV